MSAEEKQRPGQGHCENCSTPLEGRWCHACGQDARTPITRFSSFLARSVVEAFSLDAKLPRTLAELAVPGRVPRRYLAGHRVPYASPIRAALTATVLLLVLVSFLPGDTIRPDETTTLGADLRFLAREAASLATAGTLLAQPLAAAALALLFLGRGRLFVEHLSAALYLHVAVTLCLCLALLSGLLFGEEPGITIGVVLVALVLGPYCLVALRRIYGSSWLRAVLAWPIFVFVYVFVWCLLTGVSVGLAGVTS